MAELNPDFPTRETAEIHHDPAPASWDSVLARGQIEDSSGMEDAFDHSHMEGDVLDKIGHLNREAAQLSERYSRTGAMVDLEESIAVLRTAFDIMPLFSPHRRDRRDVYLNLGIQLGQRYSRIGAIVDLDEAIEITEQAVDMTTTNNPN